MDADEFRRLQEARIIANWQAQRGAPPKLTSQLPAVIDDAELAQRQMEAATRAKESWDPREAEEFGDGEPRPIEHGITDALQVAAENFGARRVTQWWEGDYAEYLRTPHWREMRQRMLLRSGGFCQECHRRFRPSELEVHHRDYRRLGAERESDLLVLCHHCHQREHA